MRKIWLILLLVVATTHAAPGRCNEVLERQAIKAEVASALGSRNFARLEAMSNDYRDNGSRTSSGLWKLTLFYKGIADSFNAPATDEDAWRLADDTVQAWIRSYPSSPSAHLARVEMYVGRGWAYRGTSYSTGVSDDAWKPFRQQIALARSELEKIKPIASSDPYWYQSMANIANLQAWDEPRFDEIVEEGLKRYPRFYEIYFRAIEYYLPKWHGDAGSIERFARTAVALSKAEEGHGLYARIYWFAFQSQYRNRLFRDSMVDWPTMKLGIDDVMRSYPDDWNTNNFAYFACLAEDKPKTAELLARIKGPPMQGVWGDQGYRMCAEWSGVASSAGEKP